VSPKEPRECSDEEILTAMRASLSEFHEIICITEAVIEQTRIMMRKFDVDWPNPAAASKRAGVW
jgi:hypothetical protein